MELFFDSNIFLFITSLKTHSLLIVFPNWGIQDVIPLSSYFKNILQHWFRCLFLLYNKVIHTFFYRRGSHVEDKSYLCICHKLSVMMLMSPLLTSWLVTQLKTAYYSDNFNDYIILIYILLLESIVYFILTNTGKIDNRIK